MSRGAATVPSAPFPRGVRPEKELVYRWAAREISRERGRGTVLDLACGRMRMARHFPGRRYIGVDFIQEHLNEGTRENPGAVAIRSRIEELPAHVSGDFVLCLQCIGMNDFFDVGNTMLCVGKMIDATLPGGTVVFNVGPRSRAKFADIEALLKSAFDRVHIRPYGRFEERRAPQVARALSHLMYYVPVLARDDARNPRRFYVAVGRH